MGRRAPGSPGFDGEKDAPPQGQGRGRPGRRVPCTRGSVACVATGWLSAGPWPARTSGKTKTTQEGKPLPALTPLTRGTHTQDDGDAGRWQCGAGGTPSSLRTRRGRRSGGKSFQ